MIVDNKIPNGWVETTLGEKDLDVLNGFAFKSKDFRVSQEDNSFLPVLKIKNVANGDANHNDVVFHKVSENVERYIIKKGDILIALTGNHPFAKTQVVGGISRYKMDCYSLLNQRVARLKSSENDKLWDDFIYYFFKWSVTQFYIGNQSSGSASQANISKNDILNTPIYLPPFLEQQAIASILTTFDDKIELLQAQNETLEATAQTIFKEWFGKYQVGDELPEGWRVGELGEEFDITMGQSPPGTSYNTDNNGTIFFQGRAEFKDRFPEVRLFTTEPKRMANRFDVLVSVRAPVGDINVALDNCCIGRGLAAVNSIYKSYCLYKLKSLKPAFDLFESEGTVFGSINKASFSNIEVVIPIDDYKKELDDLLFKIDLKIYNNYLQIQTLQQTRDTLLPKLMSGKLRVEGFKD